MFCHCKCTFDQLVTSTIELENANTHYGLQGDLIEHLWALKGTNLRGQQGWGTMWIGGAAA
jgi:hypothetical protein